MDINTKRKFQMYVTEIKSIKRIGEVETYDLNTPMYHNFFLDNGILSHNSTGSGKSWSCISMAEKYSKMFDIPFNPEDHVISSLKEMLLLITGKDVDKKIMFGSVIVFDEPQVEANATSWQSEMNQALRQLVSTFRNQRLVVFFATPYLSMIDKQSRILFHGEFKVDGFDRHTKLTTIKPRFIEYKKDSDKFYYKRLICEYAVEGKKVREIEKLGVWHVPKASDHLLEVYEKKKKEFTDNLNKKLLNQILLTERQTEGKNKNEEFLQILDFYNKHGENYIEMSQAFPHLNISTLQKIVWIIRKSKNTQFKTKNTREKFIFEQNIEN